MKQVVITGVSTGIGIVNISSTSAKIAGPFTGAYPASKFGLEGFSERPRRELILFGIDVIIIRPGTKDSSAASHSTYEQDMWKKSPLL